MFSRRIRTLQIFFIYEKLKKIEDQNCPQKNQTDGQPTTKSIIIPYN